MFISIYDFNWLLYLFVGDMRRGYCFYFIVGIKILVGI